LALIEELRSTTLTISVNWKRELNVVVRVLYHFLERGGAVRGVVLARSFGRDVAVEGERRLDLDNLGFGD
jgi:hypothetical protein